MAERVSDERLQMLERDSRQIADHKDVCSAVRAERDVIARVAAELIERRAKESGGRDGND